MLYAFQDSMMRTFHSSLVFFANTAESQKKKQQQQHKKVIQ